MKKILIIIAMVAPFAANSQTASNFKSYSKFDFIPGEQIRYSEDFSQDEIGELPLKWFTNNRGETVTIDQMEGKWMRIFPGSRFASPILQKLPESFTVEMDLLLHFNGEGGYVYPELELKLLELNNDPNARSYFVNQDAAAEAALVLFPGGADQPIQVRLHSLSKGRDYFSNEHKELKAGTVETNKAMHISIWVQKERIRYWINDQKVFDIPQAIPSNAGFNRIGFSLESSLYEESQLGIYVSNIKVAEGHPDLRKKLLEGKWVTQGILFDSNSDRIKPSSAGILKEIAAVLKENPTLRFKIIGHTDSDGSESQNLDLSKRRAEAVKKALSSEFDIDASQLTTDGKGEGSPVAENNSAEGKAKNRRVEFIKQ